MHLSVFCDGLMSATGVRYLELGGPGSRCSTPGTSMPVANYSDLSRLTSLKNVLSSPLLFCS